MLDLFDLVTPRVVVVSEKNYNKRKRRYLQERKDRYLDYIKTYEAAVLEIDTALKELED